MLYLLKYLFYNKKVRIDTKKNFECINFILDRITRLFVRNDKYVLIIEQNMLRQRFMSFVKYLFIKKQDKNRFTSEQKKALQKIQDKFVNKLLIYIATSN